MLQTGSWSDCRDRVRAQPEQWPSRAGLSGRFIRVNQAAGRCAPGSFASVPPRWKRKSWSTISRYQGALLRFATTGGAMRNPGRSEAPEPRSSRASAHCTARSATRRTASARTPGARQEEIRNHIVDYSNMGLWVEPPPQHATTQYVPRGDEARAKRRTPTTERRRPLP